MSLCRQASVVVSLAVVRCPSSWHGGFMATSMARWSMVSRMLTLTIAAAATAAATPSAAQTVLGATVDNNRQLNHSGPHTPPNAMVGNGSATLFKSALLLTE